MAFEVCKDLRIDVTELSTGAAEKPSAPKELKLFPAGEIKTTKGGFKFTAASAKSVIEKAHDYGNDLNFDYDHAMLTPFQMDPAMANRAAGWFKPEVRNGELWATDIRWTPQAEQMILNKEYRYLSPAFAHSKDGEVMELINVALTNRPATKAMAPIMANTKEQDKMDPKVIAMLGLKEGASAEEVIAVLTAWKAAAEKVTELSAKIAEYETAQKAAELASLIKLGTDEGKIPPALVDWAKGQSPEALKAFLAAAPRLVPVEAPKAAPEPKAETKHDPSALTAEDRAMMAALSVTDEKAYLERKAAFMANKAKMARKADEFNSEE